MADDRIKIGDLSPGTIALLKTVADEAVKQTFRQQFVMMGLDPDEPIAAQRVFSSLNELITKLNDEESVADRHWVRRTRIRTEGIWGKVIATAFCVVLASAIQSAFIGAKAILAASLLSSK